MDKWRQQEVHDDEDKKVLFGQKNLVDREKWLDNQFIKYDAQQRRSVSTGVNGQNSEAEDMKYKTFSKRTFRPDFVDPTDNRSLVWFVEAAENGDGDGKQKREYTGPPVRLFNRKPVVRTNTFRISDNEDDGITVRRSINDPIRVEFSNSADKVIPVGVAVPYNSHRTKKTPSPSKQPTSYSSNNGPIKIVLDRNVNHQPSAPIITRDRRSPPPPYTHKPPERTFSSSTVILGADDRNAPVVNGNSRQRSTTVRTEYSRSGNHERRSGYEDVMNAVRAPNSFRQYSGNVQWPSQNHNSPSLNYNYNGNDIVGKQSKSLFMSNVKVKQNRPAWR